MEQQARPYEPSYCSKPVLSESRGYSASLTTSNTAAHQGAEDYCPTKAGARAHNYQLVGAGRQENWENHVDVLEDGISGPLYKTVLRRTATGGFIERFVDGPLPISVSRINQWVSLFTLAVWVLLAWNVLPVFARDAPMSVKHVLVAALTAIICLSMVLFTKSKLGGSRELQMIERNASVSE